MRFVVAVLALGALGISAPVRADEGGEEAAAGSGAVELALLLGYGATDGVNVLGVGGGLRAGYVFPELAFYAGALGQLQAGTSDPGEPEVEHYARMAGLELGYDFADAPVHLRPTLRGGYADVVTPRDADDGFGSPWLGLGASVYGLVGAFHAGVDFEYRMLTRSVDNGDNAFTLAGYNLSLSLGVQL